MKLLKIDGLKAKSMEYVVVLFFFLAGCSSPTEKATDFYNKGVELLKSGELVKAKLEFQNALQINNKMLAAWVGLAEIAEKQAEWKAEFGILNKVLELDPKNLQAQVKLGRLLLMSGQLDKALDASNKAFALDKGDVSVLALRAAVFLKLDDAKGAVENANLALAKDPNYVDALTVLAVERLNAGDAVKAIEYLDLGLKQDDKNLVLQLIKIQALGNLAKLDMAEEVFRKLIKFYPETLEIRNALAQFYVDHDRKADAEKEMRAVVESNPGNLKAKLDLVRFLNSVNGPQAARQALEGFAQKELANNSLQFALVSLYQSQNDGKAAESVLRDIMKREGNAKDGIVAKGMLAGMLLVSGEKKAVLQMVDEMLAVDKRNEQALLLKASLEAGEGKLDEAISDLRTILHDTPNSSRALLLLARAHEQAGSPELADENYLNAFRAGKMSSMFGLPYAQFLLKRNQPERAEKILESILSSEPGNQVVLRMLAQSKIARSDWVGAQAIADQVRKAGNKDSMAEQITGAIFAGQKNYAESISAFKRAYEASPSQIQPVVALVRTYLMAGKVKEASVFLDSIIKNSPNNVGARLMQGQLFSLTGEIEKAKESFNSVIKMEPKNPVAYQQLAAIYMQNKQNAEAMTVIEQGLAQLPDDMGLRLAKAGMFETSGKYDDAINIYEAMLKDSPNADVVANNLASLLSEYKTDKPSLDRAFELAQRFKKSDVPQFKDTLGWASYKVGKYDDAKSMLNSAAEQLPGMPIFHYHLGMNYLAKSDKVNARKELEKALQLAGNAPFEQADEIRKTLKGL